MEFKGKIKKLFAYKQATSWCSGIIDQEDGPDIKFSGIIPGACAGYLIEGTGKIVNDPKYGPQLKVETATLGAPISKDGILKALTEYNGIGPTTAVKIYEKFGNKALNIVKKHPDKLLEVSGITEKKLEKIKNTTILSDEVQKIIVETNAALTPNMAAKVVNEWGKNALKRIKEHPYDLIRDFKGIGFKSADKIAKNLSFSPTDPQRIRAALVFLLHEERDKNGHMYLTASYVQSEILKLIFDTDIKLPTPRKQKQFEKYMTEELEDYLEKKEEINKRYAFSDSEIEFINNWIDIALEIINDLAVVIDKAEEDNEIFVDANHNIYYRFDYESEYFLSNIIGVLALSKPVKVINPFDIMEEIKNEESRSGYALGAEQKEAITTSLKSRISIITGGPGRGKTTIINTILKVWNDDENVVLCAPTGRAAQRMKQQTGHNASTIHSLILQQKLDALKGKSNAFKNKLFIVDECSMLDINLAAKLLFLIAKNDNNIIFVGDADQLPSVGAGNFFNDLIISRVIPTTVLKTGYRNSGNIADNAAKINAGSGFSKMGLGSDFTFVECEHEDMQKAVLDDYEKLLKTYAPKDICLLSPMRTRSSSGADILNDMIRKRFNENVNNADYKDCKFVLEDRVMCVKNHADKEVMLNGLLEHGVFNGDCGTVTNINLDDGTTEITFDDEKIGVFENNELSDFVLAYAITIHKSQGSEYKAVILTVTTEHFVMLQRNLLYTAVTRAKERVDLFGMKKAFNMAVRNTDYKLRNSKFKNMLVDFVKSVDSDDEATITKAKDTYIKRFSKINKIKETIPYYKDEF